MPLTAIDIAVVTVSLGIVFVVAGFGARRRGIDALLVNERSTAAVPLGFSIGSSIVGAATVVGIVSMGYKGGLAGGILGVANALGVVLFGLLLASILARQGREKNFYTVGDFVRHRYDDRTARAVAGAVALVLSLVRRAGGLSALGDLPPSWLVRALCETYDSGRGEKTDRVKRCDCAWRSSSWA